MGDNLIVIYCSEDGDKSIYRYTKADFAKKIEGMLREGSQPKFAEAGKLPNLDYFEGYIVIEGDIIQPTPVETVTKYKF